MLPLEEGRFLTVAFFRSRHIRATPLATELSPLVRYQRGPRVRMSCRFALRYGSLTFPRTPEKAPTEHRRTIAWPCAKVNQEKGYFGPLGRISSPLRNLPRSGAASRCRPGPDCLRRVPCHRLVKVTEFHRLHHSAHSRRFCTTYSGPREISYKLLIGLKMQRTSQPRQKKFFTKD